MLSSLAATSLTGWILRKPQTWLAQRQGVALSLILVLGVGLSAIAYYASRSAEADQIRAELELRVEWRSRDLQLAVRDVSQAIGALAALAEGQQHVDPLEFDRVAGRVKDFGAPLRRISWWQRISGNERSSGETSVYTSGAGDPGGGPSRSVRVPTDGGGSGLPYFLAIDLIIDQALPTAFDLSSEKSGDVALRRAIEGGTPSATVQDAYNLTALVRVPVSIYWPVYDPSEAAASIDRREQRRPIGVVAVMLDASDVVDAAIRGAPPIQAQIVYRAGASRQSMPEVVVATYLPDRGRLVPGAAAIVGPDPGSVSFVRAFEAVGVRWSAEFRYPSDYIATLRSPAPMAHFVLGLVAALLLAAYVRVQAMALRGSEAAVAGQIGKLERAGAELADREEAFQAIAELAPVGIVRTGADGLILYANAEMGQMIEMPHGELIGKPLGLRIHRDDRDRFVRSWTAALRARSPWSCAFGLLSLDGGLRWVRADARPLFSRDGEFAGHIGVVIDLTEQRTAEERRQQGDKLEAIGRLAGGVAHDFNNLMMIVLGNLEQLGDLLPPSGPAREFFDEARGAVGRAGRLTRRLLMYSRRGDLRLDVVDLNRVVDETIDQLRHIAGPAVVLDLQLGREIGLVRVDPDQLAEALVNLGVNAVDAMPEGGVLRVSTGETEISAGPSDHGLEPGRYVVLCVTDTGTGMTEEIARRALEPFYTTKRRGQGTGLGLSLVHAMVRQCRGELAIDTAPGRGTKVSIFLPAVFGEVSAPEEVSDELRRGHGETVLLVDDDHDVRRTMAGMLTSLGYRAIGAEGPLSAIGIIEGGEPVDLLLTDVMLSDGNSGIELANAIRRRRPGLPVLYISGYVDAGPDDLGVSLPVDLVIAKPVTHAALSVRLRQALDAREN